MRDAHEGVGYAQARDAERDELARSARFRAGERDHLDERLEDTLEDGFADLDLPLPSERSES